MKRMNGHIVTKFEQSKRALEMADMVTLKKKVGKMNGFIGTKLERNKHALKEVKEIMLLGKVLMWKMRPEME